MEPPEVRPPEGMPSDVEAAVRAYFTRVVRRSWPLAVVLVAVVLVVLLLPPLKHSPSGGLADGTNPTGGAVAAEPGGTSPLGPTERNVASAPPASNGPAGIGSTGVAVPLPVGITPPAPAGSAGMARSGVSCGPRIRQVPWSAYAPLCVPAYHGDNGGATSPGVTATTITLTYREASSALEQALEAQVAPAVADTNQSVINTMNAYISVFNQTFELYGRHVVLKAFQGQGDFLAEDVGQDQEQAQADAATAHDLGAFADSSILASTQIYDQGLAAERVVAVGAVAMSHAWFQQRQPYEYSPFLDCDKGALASAAVIGRAMAHLPAEFAGDAVYQHETRVFGVIAPDNPQYQLCANEAIHILKTQYGVTPARVVFYSLDPSQLETQAVSAVAQMKAAGVTSVLCACDPVSPIFLTQAADQQLYHPEWFSVDFSDAFGRLAAQDQWSHAVAGGFQSKPLAAQEAYRVYKLANPTGEPTQNFGYVYPSLVLFFDALQAAGPNLNPQTFEQGLASLPGSLPGADLGAWSFGPGTYDPPADFGIVSWSPTAVSAQDGKAGAWQSCNGGTHFTYADPGATLPDHTQLHCFGR